MLFLYAKLSGRKCVLVRGAWKCVCGVEHARYASCTAFVGVSTRTDSVVSPRKSMLSVAFHVMCYVLYVLCVACACVACILLRVLCVRGDTPPTNACVSCATSPPRAHIAAELFVHLFPVILYYFFVSFPFFCTFGTYSLYTSFFSVLLYPQETIFSLFLILLFFLFIYLFFSLL